MSEVWKDIPGYEGRYQASSLGRIRSLPNKTRKGVRVLRPSSDRQGYLVVGLHKGGVQRHGKVHLLVASAFHGERPVGLVCRHLDGVNTNNAPENLAWGTLEDNNQDTARHGSHSGVKNHAAKLSEQSVLEIKCRLGSESGVSLAAEYGVSATVISNIRKGKSWTSVAPLVSRRRG